MTCLSENTLLQLVEGSLPEDDVQRAWTHLADCRDCAHVLARFVTHPRVATTDGSSRGSSERDVPWVRKGSVVGRYVVLDRLGAGGMGEVFLAYDPQLNRRIALKLLKGHQHGSEARARFKQEAQAMARLSHPNVVTVFDVGEVDDQPFLAMELVEGTGLDQWVATHAAVRDILRVFAAAGRGLAAAHGAGMVHRDFKPQNVLVDHSGQPHVTDFGLARWLQQHEDPAAPPSSHPVEGTTRPGTVMGTPRYMSPEQLDGLPATPRSDQFSFCVALWEALYGSPPFSADSLKAQRELIHQTRLPTNPPNPRVPLSLHRALLKGLSPQPPQRHASMEVLLRELDRHLGNNRMRPLLVVGVLLVLGGLASSSFLLHHHPPCPDASQRLRGIWDESRAHEVETALRRTAHPQTTHVFQGLRKRLDAYASTWITHHAAACEATRVTGQQSEEVMLARMGCLEQRRQELKALVDVLANADAQVVERAIQAADALYGLHGCANISSLMVQDARPRDEQAAREAERLGAELAGAKARVDAGKYKEARALMESMAPAVESLRFVPLQGVLAFQLGRALTEMGELKAGAQSLRKAAVLLEKARHDEAAARAYVELISMAISRLNDMEQGTIFVEQVEACLARIGNHPELRGRLEDALAQKAFFGAENLEEALAHQHLAVDYLEAGLGPEHTSLSSARSFLGSILVDLGRTEEGIAQHEQSVLIRIRALGPDHPDVAKNLNNLANGYMHAGRLQDALTTHQRAWDLRKRVLGEKHPLTAWSMSNTGELLGLLRRDAEALSVLEQSTHLLEQAYGSNHPRFATGCYRLGNHLVAAGQPGKGVVHLQRALDIWEKSKGTDTGTVGEALTALGVAMVKNGQVPKALPLLTQAVNILSKRPTSTELALARLARAEALDAHGHPTSETLPLMQQAHDVLRGAGPRHVESARRAESWLQHHGPP